MVKFVANLAKRCIEEHYNGDTWLDKCSLFQLDIGVTLARGNIDRRASNMKYFTIPTISQYDECTVMYIKFQSAPIPKLQSEELALGE